MDMPILSVAEPRLGIGPEIVVTMTASQALAYAASITVLVGLSWSRSPILNNLEEFGVMLGEYTADVMTARFADLHDDQGGN